jgi:pimeloyl-ACP methyl ester carboxylesterase
VSSWPGLEKAAPAYGLTAEELKKKLKENNPVDRLAPLARAGVPIFHIHGNSDVVVPLEANSGTVANRYKELGGKMTLVVPKGQGHNMWRGFFECQELVDFIISNLTKIKA